MVHSCQATGMSGGKYYFQKHRATTLHYDLRLEMVGVLKSWAVPKGPSLDPAVRRLAVMVEDHELEYDGFEGVIPEGHYGAGTVMLWDFGTYRLLEEEGPEACLEKGRFKFAISGKKLKGAFSLVRMGDTKNWLLIKSRDGRERPGYDITKEMPDSVKSGRTLDELAKTGTVFKKD